MTQHEQPHLDDALRHAGTRSTERFLEASLPTDSVLGAGARPDGLARSFLEGPYGLEVVSLATFQPGIDSGLTLDIPASLAGEEPKARRMNSLASPNNIHIVVDNQERHIKTTGDFSPREFGDFSIALCGRVALAAGSKVFVYQNNGNGSGLLFDGNGADVQDVFDDLHAEKRRRFIERARVPSLAGTLSLAQSLINPENDALLVVSDFLDGYDENSDRFEWEHVLHQLGHDMDDRARVVRILSPAQLSLPMGVDNMLSLASINEINRRYQSIGVKKDTRIVEALRKIRSIELETFKHLADEHPANTLSRFIVGASLD